MKLGAFPLAAGVALLAAAAGAEPTSLAGDELRRAVSGKTVYLNVSGFELPIRYAANGRMSGKMGVAAFRLAQWSVNRSARIGTRAMSALGPVADIEPPTANVRFVP